MVDVDRRISASCMHIVKLNGFPEFKGVAMYAGLLFVPPAVLVMLDARIQYTALLSLNCLKKKIVQLCANHIGCYDDVKCCGTGTNWHEF